MPWPVLKPPSAFMSPVKVAARFGFGNESPCGHGPVKTADPAVGPPNPVSDTVPASVPSLLLICPFLTMKNRGTTAVATVVAPVAYTREKS